MLSAVYSIGVYLPQRYYASKPKCVQTGDGYICGETNRDTTWIVKRSFRQKHRGFDPLEVDWLAKNGRKKTHCLTYEVVKNSQPDPPEFSPC